jgi:hypothetical protein
MNVIRDTTGDKQYRILENFWSSQLTSKEWLVSSAINHINKNTAGTIYVFGGWYGIIAQLLAEQFRVCSIISIDIDSECEYYGNQLKLPEDNITFVTMDMGSWNIYSTDAALVINTSTEHISQNTYNSWVSQVPNNVLTVLQGNDFFSCSEHVRCSPTLEDFKKMNPLDKYILQGSLNCQTFTRWMTIGYKNETN